MHNNDFKNGFTASDLDLRGNRIIRQRNLPFQVQPTSVILALAIAAAITSCDPARADCTSSVSGGQTRVICSGPTTNHYWASENTPSSVEIQAGTTMQTGEAAIRVEGNSSVTIANGATVTVTGGNAEQAYNTKSQRG